MEFSDEPFLCNAILFGNAPKFLSIGQSGMIFDLKRSRFVVSQNKINLVFTALGKVG